VEGTKKKNFLKKLSKIGLLVRYIWYTYKEAGVRAIYEGIVKKIRKYA
jgi:hypothetical protein